MILNEFLKKYLTRILFFNRQSSVLKGWKLPSSISEIIEDTIFV